MVTVSQLDFKLSMGTFLATETGDLGQEVKESQKHGEIKA